MMANKWSLKTQDLLGVLSLTTKVILIVALVVLLYRTQFFQSTMRNNTPAAVGEKEEEDREGASSSLDWSKLLHFVPKAGSGDCRNLFTTPTSAGIKVTADYRKYRRILPQIVGHDHVGVDYAPEHEKLTLVYQELARLSSRFVDGSPLVCEIGFNAGQSALAWLTARPDLKLVSFDIGTLPFTVPAMKKVESLFPDRFTYVLGDSRVTVPRYQQEGGPILCDIVSVDGGHDFPVVYDDLVNMEKLAADKHILIADDIDYPGVRDAWNKLLKRKFLHEHFECRVPGVDIDFVVAHYKKRSK